MNFMSSRKGFYEEGEEQLMMRSSVNKGGKFHSSSSSSPPSSSSHHKGLVIPLTYHQQQQQHQRGWFDPTQEEATLGGGESSTAAGGCENADVIRRGGESSVGGMVVEREHMFDKVVTPSDVGKLNRLVIPKQHAEKYFPLDSSTNEKGLLLNFEDRNGKPWRFRYSYWNSSQSYVMTKGWSRFVKEKKLDAGDVVSFQRGVGDLLKDRLFIDWRRRPDAPQLSPSPTTLSPLPHHHLSFHPAAAWNPLFLQPRGDHSHLMRPNTRTSCYSHSNPHSYSYGGGPYSYHTSGAESVIYFRSPQLSQEVGIGRMQVERGGISGVEVEPVVYESVPVVHGKATAKRLRLFGVNMECPMSESDECDVLSSNTIPLHSTMPPHLSSSSIPYLQLRPFNGTPLPSLPSSDFLNKAKPSVSLDFDI